MSLLCRARPTKLADPPRALVLLTRYGTRRAPLSPTNPKTPSHTLPYKSDKHHQWPGPTSSRMCAHTSAHTLSVLMRPGRGQSNKHGVSAVVIRGLSAVREPLRCFLIVSLRPSRRLAFYSCSLVHKRREEEAREEGTEVDFLKHF